MIGHMPLHIVVILWLVERNLLMKSNAGTSEASQDYDQMKKIDYDRIFAWIDKFAKIVHSASVRTDNNWFWTACVLRLSKWEAEYTRAIDLMKELGITHIWKTQ